MWTSCTPEPSVGKIDHLWYAAFAIAARMFLCESIAPLGSPVVPLV
jgi:hypothetical protein